MAETRILAMDGGPAGLVYLNVLLRIERKRPGFLESVDVLAGASFGGLSALYLAKNMVPGADGTDVIEGCIAFMNQVLDLSPQPQNWQRLIEGKLPMYDNDSIERVLVQALGEDTTLGELSRRVVIVTGGSTDPTGPTIYDSEVDSGALAWEVGIETAATPILLPLRNGRIDGGLASNTPSIDAVSQVLSQSPELSRRDLVLLSLGGDGGSSSLSRLSNESNAVRTDSESRVKQQRQEALVTPEGADRAVEALLEEARQIIASWEELEQQLGSPEFADGRLGRAFLPSEEVFATDPGGANEEWGWKPWLLHLWNPVFLLQSFLNNQGLAAARQASGLLGERALRLGPMGLLNTNQLFLVFFFLGPNALLNGSASSTADLWDDPLTSRLFGFEPSSEATYDWVDEHWLSS